MIEFLGSDPCGRNEYRCTNCNRWFEIRGGEFFDEAAAAQAFYDDEPKFCPYCGGKNGV